MSQKSITNKRGASEPVLDFISGNTSTPASKRLTRNIRTTRSLWALAKMAEDIRRKTVFVLLFLTLWLSVAAQDYARARRNQQDAEYYMKKAEASRREAAELQRKAENYQREAAYYTRQGKSSDAKSYNRKAEQALEEKKTQLRYAKQNDERAAQCFRSAANALN